MDAFHHLLNPPVLFFFLGCVIALLRSDLTISASMANFFSLYLLLSQGFKGGVALSVSAVGWPLLVAVGCGLVLAVVVPLLAYQYLRQRFAPFDAVTIAAAYGSVSAVTFITAMQFLEQQGVSYAAYMTVVMILMESPAIIMALVLAHRVRRAHAGSDTARIGPLIVNALREGPNLLLLGSLVIGLIVGVDGKRIMEPFTGAIFNGILAFFLLDMGLTVVRRGRELGGEFVRLIPFGMVMPLLSATLACALAYVSHMPSGDALLLVVLAASASYIVLPAIARHAIPEANASLYLGAALVVTFPFNIVIGIPLYYQVIQYLWG